MGTVTSNISIYIPAAGETNYDQSFAAGMMNIDLHDHSGAPTHGVPLGTSSIVDGAITYSKLGADVFSTSTFTPVLSFGAATAGVQVSTGKYWLVGKIIFYNIQISLTTKSGNTGTATIEGLPFASANDAFNNVISVQSKITTYPSGDGTGYITGEQNTNNTNITLSSSWLANSSALTDVAFANGDSVRVSGFYWTL